MRKLLRLLQKPLLIILGLLVGVASGEVATRQIRPDLAHLAQGGFSPHRFRIHANRKDFVRYRSHPDSGQQHLVIRNSMGLRQHREFRPEKPDQTVRIGLFGDSFTENLRVPAQYSLSEPVDYLLNQTGGSFEVLNFGTDGYGPDQTYLQYLDEGARLGLDVVVYLYFQNDLGDLLGNELLELDRNGKLQYLPAKGQGFVRGILRRLYLTYLLIEFVARTELGKRYLSRDLGLTDIPAGAENAAGLPKEVRMARKEYGNLPALHRQKQEDSNLTRALVLFSALIREMNEAVRHRGGTFLAVIVPHRSHDTYIGHYRQMRVLLEELAIPVLDLSPIFQMEKERSGDLFFETDGHWNEEGNKIAAVYLFKFLAAQLAIDYGGDSFIREGLYRYYGAFPPGGVSASWQKRAPTTEATKQSIYARYLALDEVHTH